MKELTLNKMVFGHAKNVQPFSEILKRIQQRNYGLSSGFFNKVTSTGASTEVSKIVNESTIGEQPKLQPVPKKQYGISVIEEKNLELVNSLKEGNTFYPYNGPYERFWKIFSEDVKCSLRRGFYKLTGVKLGALEVEYFPRHTDILIVGGGSLGLTIAYAIKEKFPNGPQVIIVDKDFHFPPTSTNLGQAMISYQFFTDDEEIPILKYGAEFFSSFSRNTKVTGLPPFKLPYEPLGSLVLVDNSNIDQALKRIEALKKHEIHNKVLDPETLKSKFPWLNTNNVVFGSLGMNEEGLIDPWTYFYGLKSKCIRLGVKFVTAEVVDFGFHCHSSLPIRAICKLPDGTYNSIDFHRCILACGMEALNLTELLNTSERLNIVLKLPLEERLKYEFCFYNPEGPGINTPMVIDSSGTYFRREGLLGHYVAGVSSISNNEDDEKKDPYYVFHNRVKPFLIKRVPKFNKLQLVSGWVDLQEHCYSNDIGILGYHPEVEYIMFALGFSRLGLQYMPGVARAIMENIFYEDYRTIDFTPLHVENLWRKQHLEADRRRRELLESKKRVAISE